MSLRDLERRARKGEKRRARRRVSKLARMLQERFHIKKSSKSPSSESSKSSNKKVMAKKWNMALEVLNLAHPGPQIVMTRKIGLVVIVGN